MKKNLLKKLALCMVLTLGIGSMAACGGSKAGEMSKTYRSASATLLDGIAWYNVDDYTLQLNDNNTYQLTYDVYRFGQEDMGIRGIRTVIYYGEYSSAASSDGEPAHLDITLKPATRIYLNQQDKGFTRTTDFPAGMITLDTANWTDQMTEVYVKEDGSTGNGEDFLKQYGKEFSVTVEDPSLLPEDTTLNYRIVTIPVLAENLGES